MELKLYEKFILLVIDNIKGHFICDRIFLNYALAGILFYDLYLQEKITFKENKITLARYNYSGDPVTDEVLKMIHDSRKTRRIRYWINKTGNRSRRIRKKILKRLSMKLIIRITDHRFMGIIPYSRYRVLKKPVKEQFVKEIIAGLIQNKPLDQETIFLITLMDNRIIRNIIADKHERRIARKKVRELMDQNIFSKTVVKSVNRIVRSHRHAAVAAAT